MKYIFIFLIILSFLGPSAKSDKSLSDAFSDILYNYITCVDSTVNYLVNNVDFFHDLAQIPYKNVYKKVMEDRTLVKHFVNTGETLDDIIKMYNSDVNDLEYFRKVVYNENPDIVSKDYQVKSGSYLFIPSE